MVATTICPHCVIADEPRMCPLEVASDEAPAGTCPIHGEVQMTDYEAAPWPESRAAVAARYRNK